MPPRRPHASALPTLRAPTARPRDGQAPAATAVEMARFRERVYALVARIPPGRVATYGQLAALAGHPRRARHVGNALKHAPPGDLPWHRVLNAAGRISPRAGESARRADETVEHRQARLLAAEGVAFSGRGAARRVDLARYGWRPEEDGAALALGMGRRSGTRSRQDRA